MLLSPADQLLLDQFEHPRQIVDHVAVPEADHSVAAAREVLRPGGIFLLLLGMLSAVKLDREYARGAGKIDDIRPIGCWRRKRCSFNISRTPRQSRFSASVAARLSLLATRVLDLTGIARRNPPTDHSPSASGGRAQARSARQILPHLRQRGQTCPDCPSPPSGGRGSG